MTGRLKVHLFLVAGLAVMAGPAGPSLSGLEKETVHFAAVLREGEKAWFLDEAGKALYLQTGSAAPRRSIDLNSADGKPYVWDRAPMGLAHANGEWLVVNGRSLLFRFSEKGTLRSSDRLPTPASDVYASGGVVWICNSLARTNAEWLWKSIEGKGFEAVSYSTSGPSDPVSRLVENQLVAASGPSGDLSFARLVGPPVLTRLSVDGKTAHFALAYSRTRSRAGLEVFFRTETSLEEYSSPIRDLLVLPNGDVLALRNREDVRRGGTIVGEQARRVDRYSASGKHLGTASFEEKIRWILRDEGGRVMALTSSAEVLVRALRSPLAGAVLE